MKPEEAKEILQNRISLAQNVWSNVPDIIEYRKALELAVRGLEKQIPKKVTNLKEIYIGLGNEQKQKLVLMEIALYATAHCSVELIIAINAGRDWIGVNKM